MTDRQRMRKTDSLSEPGESAIFAVDVAAKKSGRSTLAATAKRKSRLHISRSAIFMGACLLLWMLRETLKAETDMTLGSFAALGLAALCHEGGHWLMAKVCGVQIRCITLDLFGARMHLAGLLSYRQEFFVAAGGPAANLLSLALGLAPWLFRTGRWHDFLGYFLFASFGLMAVNLLPVSTLDGGRMLSCLLAGWCGDRVARAVLTVTTGLCLLGLWMMAVYALLRAGNMLSLFVFSLCLLVRGIDGTQ